LPGRAEFLESIRHRTQAGRYKPTNAPDVAWTPKEEPGESRPVEDPAARFIEELEALGGHGARVEDLGGAREYVLDLQLSEGRWQKVERRLAQVCSSP
jgi:hypothetical protein